MINSNQVVILITKVKGKNVFYKIFNMSEINEFQKHIFCGTFLRFEDDMMVLNYNDNENKTML